MSWLCVWYLVVIVLFFDVYCLLSYFLLLFYSVFPNQESKHNLELLIPIHYQFPIF